MNKAGVSFVLGVPKDFYVLRYSELRRHQRLKNKFSQRFYFSSSCLLLPRDVNAVWKKKGTLTRLLLRGGREGQVYVKFCFTDGVTECAKLSCYQQAQSHRVRWSHRAQSLSTWKEEMTTCRRRCLSAPPVGEASACVCRSPQSETRGKQAAGRVHPRAPLMRMTVSALCLLWEGMDLMRLPVTEVVAVSVLHGSTGQKKIQKHSTSGQLCTIIHYKSCTDCCCCPLCWICSLDPCGGKKGNLSDGLHDLLWPLRSRVQSEQLGSWQSAATRRKYSDQRSVTADYTRNPRRQAARAGGLISSAGKKAFPTGSRVCPHLKESHVSKWMQSNLDSWLRSRTPRWK